MGDIPRVAEVDRRIENNGNVYEVYKRKLGQGGYGRVELGRCVRTGRLVVVKTNAARKEALAAAQKEADMLQRVRHPCVIELIDSFPGQRGEHLIVMEYATARDLAATFRGLQGPMDQNRAWEYFAQLMLAVSYLHGQGVMHRDIKPANIFVFTTGLVKLGDFGISRVLGEGELAKTFIGTAQYAPPCIFAHRPYKFPADIWSCGCVLFELFAGRPAFPGKSDGEVRRMHKVGVPVLRDFSPELGGLLRGMLQMDPDARMLPAEVLRSPSVQAALSRLASHRGLAEVVDRLRAAPENAALPEMVGADAAEQSFRKMANDQDKLRTMVHETMQAAPIILDWKCTTDLAERKRVIERQLTGRIGAERYAALKAQIAANGLNGRESISPEQSPFVEAVEAVLTIEYLG